MTATPSEEDQQDRVLTLNYSGRIIDHLGLQMYQSPVAAIAELVANAWDADSDRVEIELPTELSDNAEVIIKDDGNGMTFGDCQNRFLNVGYPRRGNNNVEESPVKKRRILGRKGIGKFAGFGIARVVHVETVSRKTGEKTVFEMDISKLRGDTYVNSKETEIDLIEYLGPDKNGSENMALRFVSSIWALPKGRINCRLRVVWPEDSCFIKQRQTSVFW